MGKGKTGGKALCLLGLMVFVLIFFISLPIFGGEQNEKIIGKLALIGNEPFTRIICRSEAIKEAEQGAFQLEGDLLGELVNLQGARVLIEGHKTGRFSEYRLPIFRVTDYQLLAVNGAQPVVGVLHKIKGRLVLTTGEGKRYFLSGPFAAMVGEYVGGKLWLTGEVKKGLFSWLTGKCLLIPDAFGVIKKP